MLDSGLWGGQLRRLRAVGLVGESEGKLNQEPLGNVNFSRGICEESKPRLSPVEVAVSWIICPKTPTKNKT